VTEVARPEDGEHRIDVHYAPAPLVRELSMLNGMLAFWIGLLAIRDIWFGSSTWLGGYLFMGALWVLGMSMLLFRRARIRRDRPPLLTISDVGIRHWDANGARLEAFSWDEVSSVEMGQRLLEGPALAVKLTPEAAVRMSYGPLGVGRPRLLDADYVIGLEAVEIAPEEVVEIVDARFEARQLERFRAAKAELEAGE
jgi:hypothetical protein